MKAIKEYFRQLQKIDRRINAKLEQAGRCREMATKATGRMTATRVSGTTARSAMENAIVRLIDLERDIDSEVDQLVDLRREALALINTLEDPRHRSVMEMRYINGWSWDRISNELNYERTWVWRLHGEALQCLQKRSNTKQHFTVL